LIFYGFISLQIKYNVMSLPYAVVTFIQDGDNEDEIVSEVTSIWLKLEEKKC